MKSASENLNNIQHSDHEIMMNNLETRLSDKQELTQILWNQLFAVVHDEDSAHVQLNVVPLLLVLKEVKGSSFGHKQQSPELQLSFH